MTIGQLMKNLRNKGWIPRGYNEVIHTVYDKKHQMIGLYKEGKKYLELVYKKSLRELCSKDSNLWQFVCENGMLDADYDYEGWALVDAEDGCISEHETGCREIQTNTDWGYRLIESALKDESELEKFLLDNIKVEG